MDGQPRAPSSDRAEYEAKKTFQVQQRKWFVVDYFNGHYSDRNTMIFYLPNHATRPGLIFWSIYLLFSLSGLSDVDSCLPQLSSISPLKIKRKSDHPVGIWSESDVHFPLPCPPGIKISLLVHNLLSKPFTLNNQSLVQKSRVKME